MRRNSREDALFAQIAQPLPIAREVAGQEEHQQNFDQLHRLERAQVHLGVVAAGAASEDEQQAEQRERGE